MPKDLLTYALETVFIMIGALILGLFSLFRR